MLNGRHTYSRTKERRHAALLSRTCRRRSLTDIRLFACFVRRRPLGACSSSAAVGGWSSARRASAAQEPSGLQAAIVLEQVARQGDRALGSLGRQHRPLQSEKRRPRDIPPESCSRGRACSSSILDRRRTRRIPTSCRTISRPASSSTRPASSSRTSTRSKAPGEIWVTTTAKRPMRAVIAAADPRSDLAVLQVDRSPPRRDRSRRSRSATPRS